MMAFANPPLNELPPAGVEPPARLDPIEKPVLDPDEYTEHDISTEEWREVILADFKIRIKEPQRLIIRKGGSTHRVVCKNGSVYCYAAPETGKSVIVWKNYDTNVPVNF